MYHHNSYCTAGKEHGQLELGEPLLSKRDREALRQWHDNMAQEELRQGSEPPGR